MRQRHKEREKAGPGTQKRREKGYEAFSSHLSAESIIFFGHAGDFFEGVSVDVWSMLGGRARVTIAAPLDPEKGFWSGPIEEYPGYF